MKTPFRVLLTLFLTSLSLICYEVSLIRVYSVIQWQNFYPIIISMAMLGFGISGSLLFILKKKIEKSFEKWILVCLLLYAITLYLGFIFSSKNPFNTFLLGHDRSELLNLLLALISIIVPFIFGSSVFGILIFRFSIHKLYSVNLLGSGFGAIFVIVIQFFVHPLNSLILISAVAFLTAILYSYDLGKIIFIKVIVSSLLLLFLFYLSTDLFNLKDLSEFKPITQTLSTKNSRILYEKFSPYGLIQVVESDTLRSFSGLSITSSAEVPIQKAIYFDGDGFSPVLPFNKNLKSLNFFNNMTSALPFKIRDIPTTLIAGSGGGEGILRSLYFNTPKIDAIEIDQNVINLMNNELLDFSGGIYKNPRVKIIKSDLRSYIRTTKQKYSLIDLSFIDSFISSSSGLNALNESYIYTKESIMEMYKSLAPNGMISITKLTDDPARANIKLLATAAATLKDLGIKNVGKYIVAIRSLQTFTLIMSKAPINTNEIEKVRYFSKSNLFDFVYYPGITESEVNRYIKLPSPVYYEASIELISSDTSTYIKDHTFNFEPATDDNPYFYNFFKLKTIKHLLKYNTNWIPITEWGYFLILILLLIVLIISFLGILLPITVKYPYPVKSKIILYFALLGLSYFFIEITLIQKSILYIGNPIYSVSFVIFGLLLFSGIGSKYSEKLPDNKNVILLSSISIVISLIFFLLLYNFYSLTTGSLHISIKVIIMLLSMFPLGFMMGIPFPRGMVIIKRGKPSLLPWAWGINGFFSVISIILASLLSIIVGYNSVLYFAAGLYLLAGFISRRLY